MFSVTLRDGTSFNDFPCSLDAKTKEQIRRIAQREPEGAEWIFTKGLYGDDINRRCLNCMIEGARCEFCVQNSRCYNCGNPWGYCIDSSRCQEEAMKTYQAQKNGRQ